MDEATAICELLLMRKGGHREVFNQFIHNYGASLSFSTITIYCIISFLAYEDISFRRRGVM